MLRITITAQELWDESKEEFVYIKEQTLKLEHSLVSLSKWESKWCKPFLSTKNKTSEQTLDYIKFMTLTQNVDPLVYICIAKDHIDQITEYIEAPMTATTFSDDNPKTINNEIVTSEIIYYWMIALNIPFECQKWHINRLITLIKVCNIKNQPAKKMSNSSILNKYKAVNAARKKQLNTKG